MIVVGNIHETNPLKLAEEIYKLLEPRKNWNGERVGRLKRKTVIIARSGDVRVCDPGDITPRQWAQLAGNCIGTFDSDASVLNIAYEITAESAERRRAA